MFLQKFNVVIASAAGDWSFAWWDRGKLTHRPDRDSGLGKLVKLSRLSDC